MYFSLYLKMGYFKKGQISSRALKCFFNSDWGNLWHFRQKNLILFKLVSSDVLMLDNVSNGHLRDFLVTSTVWISPLLEFWQSVPPNAINTGSPFTLLTMPLTIKLGTTALCLYPENTFSSRKNWTSLLQQFHVHFLRDTKNITTWANVYFLVVLDCNQKSRPVDKIVIWFSSVTATCRNTSRIITKITCII